MRAESSPAAAYECVPDPRDPSAPRQLGLADGPALGYALAARATRGRGRP
ncbi:MULTISPECIES: hypothetical protein [Streptomyces]|uniref:Uncharacterized protein n=2 Tax=Streptomyces TaxID=1883 RepID=A0ABV9IM18_9ACTN